MTNGFQIARKEFTDNSTIGELYLDGQFQCYTLEDTCRRIKIAGETAIPAGDYPLEISFSQRYQRLMPRLLNVPGYEGILIHPGNTNKDTKGCILVGETKYTDAIGGSRSAFEKLFQKLEEMTQKTRIKMSVVGGMNARDMSLE